MHFYWFYWNIFLKCCNVHKNNNAINIFLKFCMKIIYFRNHLHTYTIKYLLFFDQACISMFHIVYKANTRKKLNLDHTNVHFFHNEHHTRQKILREQNSHFSVGTFPNVKLITCSTVRDTNAQCVWKRLLARQNRPR